MLIQIKIFRYLDITMAMQWIVKVMKLNEINIVELNKIFHISEICNSCSINILILSLNEL